MTLVAPTLLDHLLAVVLVVAVPAWGVNEYARLERDLARGRPDARIRSYVEAMAVLWFLTAALAAGWLLAGRGAATLGLTLGSGRAVGMVWALAAGALGGAVLQLVSVVRDPAFRERIRPQLESVRHLLPHDRREGRWFTALGITAGICEEVLYRGFLIAYLAAFMNVWAAAVVGGVLFGVAHLYQGVGGVVKTGVLGVGLGLATVATGSILAPVVIHAVIDVVNGDMGRRILGATDAPDGSPA